MSRRTRADKREILPEPKYSSRLLAKFINVVMRDGKKSIAETIVYDALETFVQKLGEPLEKAPELFEEVLENQIPVEVRQERREALAMRWLIEAARSRSEKNMKTKLANELLDASNNRGITIKKKEETHRMAEANKAFSHFRW